jgi:hypothetical protein
LSPEDVDVTPLDDRCLRRIGGIRDSDRVGAAFVSQIAVDQHLHGVEAQRHRHALGQSGVQRLAPGRLANDVRRTRGRDDHVIQIAGHHRFHVARVEIAGDAIEHGADGSLINRGVRHGRGFI